MTQASLTPDLNGALGASTPAHDTSRSGWSPETALWLTAVTSGTLVVASLLMLGLIARNVVSDASLGGFVSGVSIMIALVGLGSLAYVLAAARRQGLLGSNEHPGRASESAVPSGMHVVAARPAELGRRKRREIREQQAARSQQAKAIATAIAPATAPAVTKRPAPAPRPAPARRSAQSQSEAGSPAPTRPVPVRVAPYRQAPARPAPPTPTPVVRPIQRRVAQPAPMRTPPVVRPPARPAIRMPRTVARPARPDVSMAVPSMRMAPLRLMPRTQASLLQVRAANVRAAGPVRPR